MPHPPPAHHETSKHDSSNEIKIKVKQTNHPGFEFKPHQVSDSSQSNQETDHLISHQQHLEVQRREPSSGLPVPMTEDKDELHHMGHRSMEHPVCRHRVVEDEQEINRAGAAYTHLLLRDLKEGA
jgi:hypothetical protein